MTDSEQHFKLRFPCRNKLDGFVIPFYKKQADDSFAAAAPSKLLALPAAVVNPQQQLSERKVLHQLECVAPKFDVRTPDGKEKSTAKSPFKAKFLKDLSFPNR